MKTVVARMAFLLICLAPTAADGEAPDAHGLVGLRLLPHDAEQTKAKRLSGVGNYAELEGQSPFVAENLDVIWGPRGGFKTGKSFFEWYVELDGGDEVNPDPHTSKLVQWIRRAEQSGFTHALHSAGPTNEVKTSPQSVDYILICRETRLTRQGKPGPFKEDYRILYPEDVTALRKLFREAHAAGLLRHDNYKLIQMVEHPSFFAENPEAQKIIRSMDGVTYEAHQMNRHWPLKTGWSRPGPVVRGARWTLDQGLDYIFYYGPFRFRENEGYREFVERDWLQEFWQAGLPKRHPKMHYFLNAFPHEGSKRPVGPESDPHSNLGLTKWLIGELRGEKQEVDAADGPAAPEASQVAGSGNAVSQNKALDYPTEAKRIPLEQGQVYSRLTWQQSRAGVPEIRLLKKTTEAIEYVGPKKHLLDTKEWQESPSRIIYHDGKYHTWVMNIWDVAGGENPMPPDYGSQQRNFYLTSEDGHKWRVEGLVPDGEKGSFDERWREGLQVVKYDGKFWMFYAGNAASDPTRKQYPKRTGGGTQVGLLVADSPAGPWTRAVEQPLFGRSDNPKAWDFDQANNPYPVYFKGKWFVYYKSRNRTLSGSFDTLQGVAVADKITGPYVKYENNPVCDGHGSFVWAWRGGIAMQPFGNGGHLIHWSPDGLHWHMVDDPRSRGVATPVLSALYLPHDPLSGEPVTDKEPHIFWGLETDPKKEGGVNRYNIIRSTVEFNEVSKNAGGPAKQDLQFMDVGN